MNTEVLREIWSYEPRAVIQQSVSLCLFNSDARNHAILARAECVVSPFSQANCIPDCYPLGKTSETTELIWESTSDEKPSW